MADFKRMPIDLAHLGAFFLWMLCVAVASVGIGLLMIGLQLNGYEGELAREAARAGAQSGPPPGQGNMFLMGAVGAWVTAVLVGFGARATWRWARRSDRTYAAAHPERDDKAGFEEN